MEKRKKIIKWIGNGFIGVLLLLVLVSVYSNLQGRGNPNHIPSVMGYSPMSVLTGSMRPMLEPGDMIITKIPVIEHIQVGDVITYRVDQNTLVTHRVIDIISLEGARSFQTQGDANNAIDQSLVLPSDVVGTYVFRIPKGGYIAKYIRSPFGFVLFILVPMLLLLGGELKKILFEMDQKQKI